MNSIRSFLQASTILIIGSITAGISHLFAHLEADFRFTLIGFMVAITSGIYYGLKVPNSTVRIIQSNNALSIK